MFKAAIIQNERFFTLRKRAMWFTLLLLPVWTYFTFFDPVLESNWLLIGILTLGMLVFGGASIFLFYKMKEAKGTHELRADENKIEIVRGSKVEEHSLQGVKRMEIKMDFNEMNGGITEHFKEGRTKNYIELDGDRSQRWYLFLDSAYMQRQLEKLIVQWRLQGIDVTVVGERQPA